MAYVMLGRCEVLDDIYIAGNFQADGIACSTDALNEANRLQEIFEKDDDQNEEDQKFKISFLNTRSLKKHEIDLRMEPLLMKADIFCLFSVLKSAESRQGALFSCFMCYIRMDMQFIQIVLNSQAGQAIFNFRIFRSVIAITQPLPNGFSKTKYLWTMVL